MNVCSECWTSGLLQSGKTPDLTQLPRVQPCLLRTSFHSPHLLRLRAAPIHHKLSSDSKSSPSITCAKKSPNRSSATKTTSPNQLRDWTFVELSTTWDHVFETSCHVAERAAQIRSIAEEGERQWGRGCVLLSDCLVTVPIKSKGFGGKIRRPPPPADDDHVDPQPATSLGWSVRFIPRAFILEPESIEELTSAANGSATPGSVPVISKADLISLFRTLVDHTRLLTLSAPEREPNFRTSGNTKISQTEIPQNRVPNSTSNTKEIPNFTPTVDSISNPIDRMSIEESEGDYIEGEEPYRSSEGDVLLVVFVTLDGQPVAGADVIELLPESQMSTPGVEVDGQSGLYPRYRTRGLDC